ncbi:helix-turn-helix domain-containing protein [Flavobacterium sp. FlaQc-52]|jgi:AraC-like DNA-binding protein|uniref:helix-turn-helix domain-containing protein n=1 Tax=Flavobacterium sp. FlaQc-52 TaxID=3374185 RepID=UPI00375677CE
MMDILLSLFFFIATIVGFATSFRVLFSRKNYAKSFFLGLFMFSLATVSVYNFYLSVSAFKNVPDLFGITKAFIFLVAPCSFLYVRNVLFSTKMFKKYDWLHFLPFVLYFGLTFIVWIAADANIPIIAYVSSRIKNPFTTLSLTFWLVYAFWQTMMILNCDLEKLEGKQAKKIKIIQWLRVYNLVILFLFSTLFVHFFLKDGIKNIDTACYILISSVLFFTVGGLYFKPHLFADTNETYHSEENKSVPIEVNEVKDTSPLIKELTTDRRKEDLLKLDSIFSAKKLFLKKDFVIRDLAEETGISVHQLSNLINSEFNLHFQDYVNLKRIEFFKDKINDPEWKDLSLEGMAWGSGFKSRTTCFRAFIKHTGKSPSEYFKAIREDSDKTNVFYLKQS